MIPSVLLVDKPKGLTSSKIVENLRKRFKVKAGHTGTLDPMATGLLILLLNEATRYAEFFIRLSKEYVAVAKLGEIRDTYDAEGKVLEKIQVNASCEDVKKVLKSFLGKISQLPPPYSAKRVEGRRAYDLARRGIKVNLKSVEVEVFKAELLECKIPQLKLLFCVSSGTYIRSLVNDIGLKLGCGAYVEELRRIKIGSFDVNMAIAYERLMSITDIYGVAIPIWEALNFLPAVRLDVRNAERIKKGLPVTLLSCSERRTFVRLFDDEKFIGVGVADGKWLKAYRLLPQT